MHEGGQAAGGHDGQRLGRENAHVTPYTMVSGASVRGLCRVIEMLVLR